ncbi:putative NADPH dehydrogenase [Candida viswanathii]|uniref:Putative NADPH dehydrogenase n=1 Tax=Candida viswanathii TaxID=5486 RepID=A0A367XQS3_9ASCO|nr:putative NADPH dehydrogenase [Candida viswanathii]
MTTSKSNLFKPIKIGNTTIKHRIAHLPTTRSRATAEHVPTDLNKTYYTDRAKSGALIIAEATLISLNQGIYPHVPGIWTQQQSDAWKEIVDSVHAVGGKIALQLWALGRVGNAKLLKENGLPLTGASPIYEHEQAEKDAIEAGNPIQELTQEQIKDLIFNQYTNAVKLADAAGFDFIELHGANGYLIEQFISPVTNKRTDKYGGSIENRSRFLFELIDHLNTVVDPAKLAIRLSPLNDFQVPEVNPSAEEDYTYIIEGLQQRADEGKGLAFIDVVDERYNPDGTIRPKTVQFVDKVWKGVLVKGGSFTYDKKEGEWTTIQGVADADDRTLIGFGRHFIANPDLPERIKNGYPLNPYDRSTFYAGYNYGYNTYPFYGQEINADPEEKLAGKALA